MLSMTKSINAALFGSILITLPLAVAGLPRSANPYLVPHTEKPFQVAPAPPVHHRHPSHRHHANVRPCSDGL